MAWRGGGGGGPGGSNPPPPAGPRPAPPRRPPAPRGSLLGQPQLVAQVAGVAGARNVEGDRPDLRAASAEVAQVGEGFAGGRLQDGPALWALEGQRGERLGDVLAGHVQTGGGPAQPGELR